MGWNRNYLQPGETVLMEDTVKRDRSGERGIIKKTFAVLLDIFGNTNAGNPLSGIDSVRFSVTNQRIVIAKHRFLWFGTKVVNEITLPTIDSVIDMSSSQLVGLDISSGSSFLNSALWKPIRIDTKMKKPQYFNVSSFNKSDWLKIFRDVLGTNKVLPVEQDTTSVDSNESNHPNQIEPSFATQANVCHKCGNQSVEESVFCQKCGEKLISDDTAQPTTVESAPTTLEKSVESKMNQECSIRFLPRKVFGQWMLRKAAIDIDGNTHTTKIKKPIDFTIRSGAHNVLAYGAFFGKSCKAQFTHNFEPGKQYLIRYKTRVFTFTKGKIKIEEYPDGVALPKK